MKLYRKDIDEWKNNNYEEIFCILFNFYLMFKNLTMICRSSFNKAESKICSNEVVITKEKK